MADAPLTIHCNIERRNLLSLNTQWPSWTLSFVFCVMVNENTDGNKQVVGYGLLGLAEPQGVDLLHKR